MIKQLTSLVEKAKSQDHSMVGFHLSEMEEIIEAFRQHDKRVTELIRANSENVIRRRVLAVRVRLYEGVLKQAIGWFKDYAQNHFAKGTPEADAKGQTNLERAQHIQDALDTVINPSDYGRP